MTKPTKKEEALEGKVAELTADLQRLRADFENYRKRVEQEKAQITDLTKAATTMKLLPIIDTIERAVAHTPEEIAENSWVKGVVSLTKNLEKSLSELGIERIKATAGTSFDPNLHEAISVDEATGEQEVVAEELRAGYTMNGTVVRPSMVKVTRK